MRKVIPTVFDSGIEGVVVRPIRVTPNQAKKSVDVIFDYIFSNYILRLRTKDNLDQILKDGKSSAWEVAEYKESYIENVEVYNWDGTKVVKGIFDAKSSYREPDENGYSRLIVVFTNGSLETVTPPLEWSGQNPVQYIEIGHKPKIYWHNIGFNDEQWWQYLKTNKIITANFKNEPGDEGEKLLTSYREGDTIIAYANSFGAVGWGIIKQNSNYRLIEAGSSEDVRHGRHLHRLDIEWQCVADKIENAISAKDILSKFGVHHPIKTSVRIDNEKGKLLIQELENKL
jgi:hypothetical protein